MGILASILSGPIVGLFGSIVSAFVAFKERQQKIEEQKLAQAHEVRLLEMNINARGQEMENEQIISQMEAMSEMLSASYQHDASYGPVSENMAAFLRLIRPSITLLLIILTALVFFMVEDAAIITVGEEAMTVQERVVMSILFMTEAAVTWWFADRRRSQK
jgi:hypothetical protein